MDNFQLLRKVEYIENQLVTAGMETTVEPWIAGRLIAGAITELCEVKAILEQRVSKSQPVRHTDGTIMHHPELPF